MAKLSIDDLDLKGKRVLVRVDFNVPLNEKREVTDDTRIKAALPTINRIITSGGKAILMSHLGRPKGDVKDEMRLAPAGVRLSQLIGQDVQILDDCIGPEVKNAVENAKEGDVILLENLRFYSGETKNDPEFAKQLAAWGDVYVNDAFGTAHRAHASTEGVTKYFDICAAGYLIQKELQYLGNAVETPQRPFLAILGGAKISGKIDVIENLLGKVDSLIIGGGMAYTFFKAQGFNIGKSLLEEDKVELAAQILDKAEKKGVNLFLPVDNVISTEVSEDANTDITTDCNVPDNWLGVDIGPKSIQKFQEVLMKANTIVWNGPMGIFELDKFSKGTIAIAESLAARTKAGAVSVVGGGDSVAALAKAKATESITHVSTGGGASLEFLGGFKLPGIEALNDK
ncbi:MAG: phosphoglycerate kinase [candidate division KSB1 bacterium]|jgi:phosphoglycerate kinase|nr:phosphoglycerate kinase [candidate division KSB1 bacterium]